MSTHPAVWWPAAEHGCAWLRRFERRRWGLALRIGVSGEKPVVSCVIRVESGDVHTPAVRTHSPLAVFTLHSVTMGLGRDGLRNRGREREGRRERKGGKERDGRRNERLRERNRGRERGARDIREGEKEIERGKEKDGERGVVTDRGMKRGMGCKRDRKRE